LYSGGNHLSTNDISSVLLLVHFLGESAPTIIWVSHSWGLPRSTLFISEKATSLWHFQSIHTISIKNLGIFPAVNQFRHQLPWLMTSPSTNTTRISACVSMDFPLHGKPCSDYPNVINEHRIYYSYFFV
jgi:hypothetical protein